MKHCESASYLELPFDERLAMLVDREFLRRAEVMHTRKRRDARLKADAVLDNVDLSVPRNLQKGEFFRYTKGRGLGRAVI